MANTIRTAANLLAMRWATAHRRPDADRPLGRTQVPAAPAVGILLVEELPTAETNTFELALGLAEVAAVLGAAAAVVLG